MSEKLRVQKPRRYKPIDDNMANKPARNYSSRHKSSYDKTNVYKISDYQTNQSDQTKFNKSQRTNQNYPRRKRRPNPQRKPQPRSKPWAKSQRFFRGLPSGRPKIFVVTGILLIIFFTALYKSSVLDKVNNVYVYGNNAVPSELIVNSSGIEDYYPISLVNQERQKIKNKIQDEIPLVKSVDIKRESWKSLDLYIVEHEAIAKIQNGEVYQLVLSNGKIIETNSQEVLSHYNLDQLVELKGFNSGNLVKDMANCLTQIDQSIINNMESITYEPTKQTRNRVVIQMADGNTISGIILSLPQKIQHYPQILSTLNGQTGTINFEVGAYFTPYENDANSINLSTN